MGNWFFKLILIFLLIPLLTGCGRLGALQSPISHSSVPQERTSIFDPLIL